MRLAKEQGGIYNKQEKAISQYKLSLRKPTCWTCWTKTLNEALQYLGKTKENYI